MPCNPSSGWVSTHTSDRTTRVVGGWEGEGGGGGKRGEGGRKKFSDDQEMCNGARGIF
jgi:hypothetical protein